MNQGGIRARGRGRSASPDFTNRNPQRDGGWANSIRGSSHQQRGGFNNGPDSFRPPQNNFDAPPHQDRFSSAPFPSHNNNNNNNNNNNQQNNLPSNNNFGNSNNGGGGNMGRFDGPPPSGGGQGGYGNQGGFQQQGGGGGNQGWGGGNQGMNNRNDQGWNNNNSNDQPYFQQQNQGGGGREAQWEQNNRGNFRGGMRGGFSERGDRSPPGRRGGGGGDMRGGMSPRGGGNYRGGPDRGRGGGMSHNGPPHQSFAPQQFDRPTGTGGRRDEYRRNFDDDDGSFRGSGGGGREDYNAPRPRPSRDGFFGTEGGGEGTGRMIQERVRKEKPCRTLFVRNLKFETSPEEVRGKFDMMGEVKTFFDLIANRGMVFITYYDLRAAMMAKEKLQGTEVTNRSIDVHYSLPRDADRAKRCDREKNQGSLTLQIPDARGPIIDSEIAAKFGKCGDIRAIFPSPERPNERYIEFFDIRACERAYDELNGAPLAGGSMELRFAWDVMSSAAIDPPMPPSMPQQSNVGGYGATPGPVSAPVGSLNERLEQAQKVQQLLQSLGTLSAPPPPLINPSYPPPNLALPAIPHHPQGSLSPLPPVPLSYAPPPPVGVPPNVLAMLAAAQNAARSSPPVQLPPPVVASTSAVPAAGAADQVSALLALLAQTHGSTPPPR